MKIEQRRWTEAGGWAQRGGQDLGGDATEGQKAIAARAATLGVWCEAAEVAYVQGVALDVGI